MVTEVPHLESLRLAVFDCDGTLVDSGHSIVAAMHAACDEHDCAKPAAADIRRMVGLPLAGAFAGLLPGAGAETLAKLKESYQNAFAAMRRRGEVREPLFPGALEGLTIMEDAGWLLGMATGKSRRGLAATLDGHGLGECFVTLQTADRCQGKPHPEMLLNAMAETIDLTPTILDLAGIDIAHDQFGKSLVPLLRGETDEHRDAVFAEGGHGPHEAQSLELTKNSPDPDYVYYQKGRIQTDNPSAVCKSAMVRTLDWKYVSRLDDTDELYDMQNDPGEMVNLVDRPEHAAIQAELHDRLLRWFLETGDVVPWEKDEAGRPANE